MTLTSTMVMECKRLFFTPTGFLLFLFIAMDKASFQVLKSIRNLTPRNVLQAQGLMMRWERVKVWVTL